MHRAQRSGRVKYWMLVLVAGVVLAFVVGILSGRGSHDTDQLSSPSASSPTATTHTTTPTPVPTLSSPSTATPSATPAPVVIKQSQPVEVYIPSIDIRREVHAKACPIVDGKIDPDRSDYMVACAMTGENLASELPGTASSNTTMIVGHTWRAKPTWRKSVEYAAFNALYNWETGDYTLKPGAEIWIRTKASGKRWLVYRVTGFSQPTKTVGNDDLWDFADKPQPNTLKLVGCQQPSDYDVHSTNNIVVKATFSRVEG